jgi:hypothetical protein
MGLCWLLLLLLLELELVVRSPYMHRGQSRHSAYLQNGLKHA